MSPFQEFCVDSVLRPVNRVLKPVGLVVFPSPPSAKMLHEHANVAEVHHPSQGGATVRWLRRTAELLPVVSR